MMTFCYYLQFKEQGIIDLYGNLREFVLSCFPDATELIYNTHALTSVYSVSDKLSDAFCHIPIYKAHLNLGFNYGSLLDDPMGLLTGTGKLIRHIPVADPKDYRNKHVKALIRSAIEFALDDIEIASQKAGKTISKIKRIN